LVKAKDREMSHSESNLHKQGLDGLSGIIIAAHLAVCKADGSALDSALRAGEALLETKRRRLVHRGQQWQDFCEQTCGSSRTARVYTYLAANWLFVEPAKWQSSATSIAAALRLIHKAKGTGKPGGSAAKSENPPSSKDSLAPAKSFDGWEDHEIRNALLHLGFDRFVQVIPTPHWALLERRMRAQVIRMARAQPVKTKLKDFVPRLVAGTDVEETPPTQH
jgi:hypothetical protein